MPQSTWDDLPAPVRAAIARECGQVSRIDAASAGSNARFAATLHTPEGLVFCKAAPDDDRSHRHEAAINPWLPHEVTPRLLWQTEAAGWLVLGFEHVAGRHADLTPGSTDLPLVAETVSMLADKLRACTAPNVPALADKLAWMAGWRRLRHKPPAELDHWSRDNLGLLVDWEARGIDAAAGNALLHTDLHQLNVLVSDRARVIDWAWSRTGAAWTDTAHLVVRLIDQGHTSEQAEGWAAGTSAWPSAMPEALTGFAVALLGMWTYLRHTDPQPQRPSLVIAARTWVQHRLTLELGGTPCSASTSS